MAETKDRPTVFHLDSSEPALTIDLQLTQTPAARDGVHAPHATMAPASAPGRLSMPTSHPHSQSHSQPQSRTPGRPPALEIPLKRRQSDPTPRVMPTPNLKIHPLSKGHWLISKVPLRRPRHHRNYPVHIMLLDEHKAKKAETPAHLVPRLPKPTKQVHRPASHEQINATMYLGFATAFCLMAFNVCQNYLTSIHPHVGSITFVLIYVSSRCSRRFLCVCRVFVVFVVFIVV